MSRLQTMRPRLKAMSGRIVPLAPTAAIERKRGSAGVKGRNSIKSRDRGLCQACRRNGFVTLGAQVDHIVPLWRGGSDEDSNKELLCAPCHDIKTRREAAERARGG